MDFRPAQFSHIAWIVNADVGAYFLFWQFIVDVLLSFLLVLSNPFLERPIVLTVLVYNSFNTAIYETICFLKLCHKVWPHHGVEILKQILKSEEKSLDVHQQTYVKFKFNWH